MLHSSSTALSSLVLKSEYFQWLATLNMLRTRIIEYAVTKSLNPKQTRTLTQSIVAALHLNRVCFIQLQLLTEAVCILPTTCYILAKSSQML